MRLLDAYIGRNVALGALLALAVLTSLAAVVTFVDDLDSVGRQSYGILEAFEYTFLTLPRQAFVMFPFAAVIGALVGLGACPRRRSLPWSGPPACRARVSWVPC